MFPSEYSLQGIEQPVVAESSYQQASDFVFKLTEGVFRYKSESRVYGSCTPFVLDELRTHIPVLIEKIQTHGDKKAWLDVLTFLEHTGKHWRGRDWQEAREAVVGDMAKILPQLKELFVTGETEDRLTYFHYLFFIRKLVGDDDTRTEQTESLVSSIEQILHEEKNTFLQYLQSIENIQNTDNPDNALDCLKETFRPIAGYIAYASSHDVQEVEFRAEVVFDALKKGKTDYILELLGFNTDKTGRLADRYINNILCSAGIANHMGTFWGDIRIARVDWAEKIARLTQLLDAIEVLSAEGADIPQVLHDVFGIVRFDRYNPQTLIEMYQDCKNPTQEPYVLAVYPKSDWNNSFLENATYSKCADFSSAGYKLRVIEAGNLEELILRGIQVKQLFGQASGIILGGHGTGSSIQLGKNVYLSAKDFQTRGGQIIKKGLSRILRPGSTVVLDSCHAGIEGGIAQQISEDYGLTVIGCDKASSTKHIVSARNKDALTMYVTYTKGRTKIYKKGIPQQIIRRSQQPLHNKFVRPWAI
jgi:hypothetical protein